MSFSFLIEEEYHWLLQKDDAAQAEFKTQYSFYNVYSLQLLFVNILSYLSCFTATYGSWSVYTFSIIC